MKSQCFFYFSRKESFANMKFINIFLFCKDMLETIIILLLLNMVKDYDQNDEKNHLRRIKSASHLRCDLLISKKIQLPQI